MHKRILKELESISNEHDVLILYACESGSRAWGFPSRDSDYDVRFIYLHNWEWYMAIDIADKPDVIEYPINDDLDISGWDLKKALRLFHKSNPPLLEWLSSPIIYMEKPVVIHRLRELAPQSYSPASCMYHYYKMAKNNFRGYLKGEQVRLKKYLYVLRPVLAVLYLEQGKGPVPMQFSKLVDAVVKDSGLLEAINKLVKRKIIGDELGMGPRDPILGDFLETQLNRMENLGFEKRIHKCPVKELNQLFLAAVELDWFL